MKTVGPYPVTGLLGRGGTAVVYRVRHPRLGLPLALKWLRPRPLLLDLVGEAALRQRFLAEAELLARLRHRHLAAVHDVGESQGWPFLVLEYRCVHLGMVLGEVLAGHGPCRALDPAWALERTRQLLAVLGYLHGHGVVHRDVQPANVLLAEDGDVRLIDLGLALRLGETEAVPPQLRVGTPFYAAPEQEADPGRVGPAADLYGAGVLLHRMVSGHLPPAPGQVADHPVFSRPWRRVLTTALAADPRQRFPSAQAMADALPELEEAWTRQRETACALTLQEGAALPVPARSAPVRTGVRPAQPFSFLDPLGRPRHQTVAGWQERQSGLWDAEARLLWQARVSAWPMTWAEAHGFVAEAGFRLPTVEEGVRLVGSGTCPLWPALPGVAWLWTADRRGFTSAWCLDVRAGAVTWLDCGLAGCLAHAVGVRGPL